MHEVTIVKSFVDTTQKFAEDHGIQKVERVTLSVGALTGAVPKYIRMYYDDIAAGTRLEGSELVIDFIEPEVFCRGCGNMYNPNETDDQCPLCKDKDFEVIRGRELTVRDIAYEH